MKSKKTASLSEPATQPLNRQNVENINWEVQGVQLAIACRAYELFQTRGSEHGHDWEDWFQAESELLRPVSVVISESNEMLSVRANVFGFEKEELKVGVEPRRITILGKKQGSVTESEGGKVEYIDWYPDQILKLIDLAADVVPESSVVELQGGLLRLELPKAAPPKAESAAAAARAIGRSLIADHSG